MLPIRKDCVVTFKKTYFTGGSFGRFKRKPKLDGHAVYKAQVLRHSYGAEKGQHTFTLLILDVIENESEQSRKVGEQMRIKGRNLYPNVINHEQGEESKKVRDNDFAEFLA